MMPEELRGRPSSRATMKEQERERRRMRDRQRRQSMSIEEREKHLARRRRNYQLRKQRMGEAQQDSQQAQTSISSETKLITGNDNQAVLALHDCVIQDDGAIWHVDSSIVQGIPSGSSMSFDGCEVTNSPRRLRVKQIRHLARLLNTPIHEPSGGIQQEAEALVEHSVTRNCESRKTLRLIHVKRLARALHSTMGRISGQSHFDDAQGAKACSGIESAAVIDSIEEQ